jgi:hypothetical protein
MVRDRNAAGSEAGDGRLPRPAAWLDRRVRLGLEGFLESEHSAAFRSLIEQLVAPRPAAEDIRDPRTAPQRNADALLEVCGLARAAQDCPTTAGEPPHLTVTIDRDALRTGLGTATLDYGTIISAAETRRLACDAKIIPVVLGGNSEPLAPGMCQAHHCRHWVDDGGNSVENCVILRETHHRHVHRTGWEILIRGGHVDFIPPAIIDLARKPLRC